MLVSILYASFYSVTTHHTSLSHKRGQRSYIGSLRVIMFVRDSNFRKSVKLAETRLKKIQEKRIQEKNRY